MIGLPSIQKPLARGEFAKYEALGNAYLVVDTACWGRGLSAEACRRLCDVRYGIGSDGVLLKEEGKGEAFALRIVNPDGSEAETSGNGLRIFARFLYDFGYTSQRTLRLKTPSGEVSAELLGAPPEVESIRVGMGCASFLSTDLPMTGAPRQVVGELLALQDRMLEITAVSVGNPHCVHFMQDLDADLVRSLGPALAHHPCFPRGVNVQVAQIVHRRRIDMRVWERGVGPTLASGSSSCAVAAAAYRQGKVDSPLWVHMPGGRLQIDVDANHHIRLTGPVEWICRGKMAGT